MHPVEKMGWRLCADPMSPDDRAELAEVLRGVRDGLRAAGERRLLCHVQMCLSVHELFRGNLEASRPLLDEAISLADRDLDRQQYLTVLQMEGTFWLFNRDPARACEAFVTMRHEAQADGVATSLRVKSTLNLAYALACLGDLDGALALTQDAASEAGSEPRRRGEIGAVRLAVLVDARRWDDAGRQLDHLEAELARGADYDRRARALTRLAGARVWVERGDLDRAEADARAALTCEMSQLPEDCALSHTVLGEVALRRGDLAGAVRAELNARLAHERAAHGPRLAATLALRARLLHRQGRTDAMFALVEDSLAASHTAGLAGRMLHRTLQDHLVELHQLREVELRATNDALRRMHRQESEARAQAEEAASARHRFLSAMSHELRTPLTGVVGAAALLEQTELTDEQARLVGITRRSADLTLRIIDDILDLGRIESGRLSLEHLPFELARPIEDVLSMVRPQALAAGVQLLQALSPDLPRLVRGDERRLKQVLLNLVSNAIKFTRDGNVEVRVSVAPEGLPTLRFEVSDEGIGIPEAAQSSLFEPWTQATEDTARSHGGSGLGLAICRSIVEASGGLIGVHSQPGKGATFWFELALMPTVAPSTTPALHPPPTWRDHRLSGLRVLLADDNAVNRQLGAMLLANLGAEVETVDDGVQAIEAATHGPFDLVLMDMHMPHMGGLEATRHLRAAGYMGAVVALTAAVLPEDRAAALNAGMDAFATKPIEQSALLQAISSALTHRLPLAQV